MADYSEDYHDYDLREYAPPSPFSISSGLVTGCVVCGRKDGLSRCGACKVVYYCGRDHQVADRPAHKSFCNKIKKAQAVLDEEEEKLRTWPGDFITPANPFETCVGHFWGIHGTRDYMRARFAVVNAQLNFNTQQAVEAALGHITDMLRLCRGDNLGLREIAPALFLRLGRDQECYDFCKWWATTGSDDDYAFDDISSPYLDTKNADVFESANVFDVEWPDLSYLLAITLLKIRLLIDLQALERVKTQAGPNVPPEILDTIREYAVSPIIAGNRDILERDQTSHMKELQKQVKQLYDAVNKDNKYVWQAMLRPGNQLTARPGYTSQGTIRDMQQKLQYNYNAWAETPGAIGVIEELSKR